MDDILQFFGAAGYMPHGHCYLWKLDLLLLHGLSDLLIFCAYTIIPLGLLRLLRLRPDLPVKKIILLFVAFITLCGWTHINELVSIWIPLYWYTGLVKALTACVSLVTAFVLTKLVSEIVTWPKYSIIHDSVKQEVATIINSIATGVLTVNKEGIIEYINLEGAKLFGYDFSADLVGKDIEAIIPERFRSTQQNLFAKFFDSEGKRVLGSDLELLGLRKDGSEFYLKIGLSTAMIVNEDKVVATIFDQTQLKSHEAEIRKLSDRFSFAVDGSNDGLWDWYDVSQGVVWWSDKSYELLGQTPESLAPSFHSFLRLVEPRDREIVKQSLRNHFKNNEPLSFDCQIKTGESDYRWFRIRGKATISDDKPTRISGTLSDIHDQKKFEINYKKQNDLLRFMQEETTDGWWDWNIEYGIEYVSPKFWSTLGYEVPANPLAPSVRNELLLEEDRMILEECYKEHVSTGGISKYQQNVRYRLLDGTYKTLICRGKVVEWDSSNKPLRMVGSHTDITELLDTQQKLVQLNDNLKKVNQELEKFAHVVSHDLRAPARHILQYSQNLIHLFSDEDINKEEAMDSLKAIEKNSVKISEMIQGLLSVSKLQKQSVIVRETYLSQILQEVCYTLEINIKEADAIIEIDEDQEIAVDPALFERVLQNLIDNSLKYRHPDRQAKIKIKVDQKGDYQTITISDNGIGIHESFLPKVFDIFEKGAEALKFDAHGIGLAICKKIVELHRGSIELSSEYGKGTIFTIKLKGLE